MKHIKMPQSIERKRNRIEEYIKNVRSLSKNKKKKKRFQFILLFKVWEQEQKKINHSYLMCSFPFLSNRINDFSLFPMNKHKKKIRNDYNITYYFLLAELKRRSYFHSQHRLLFHVTTIWMENIKVEIAVCCHAEYKWMIWVGVPI